MNKTQKLSILSLLFNIAYSAYHIGLGVWSNSWWLFTIGIYYAILSLIRFAILRTKQNSVFLIRFTGIMLMLLSVPLVGTVILSVVRDRGKVMHMIIMITIAAYTFTKITFAIINLVRLRKGSSAKLIALRNISLADSCVSIFALQRSMLVSFPGMAADDIRIMNAVFGSAICIIVFLLGYNLIRNEKFWFKSIK